MHYFIHKDILIKSYFSRKVAQVWKDMSDSNPPASIIRHSTKPQQTPLPTKSTEFCILTFQVFPSPGSKLPFLFISLSKLPVHQPINCTCCSLNNIHCSYPAFFSTLLSATALFCENLTCISRCLQLSAPRRQGFDSGLQCLLSSN